MVTCFAWLVAANSLDCTSNPKLGLAHMQYTSGVLLCCQHWLTRLIAVIAIAHDMLVCVI